MDAGALPSRHQHGAGLLSLGRLLVLAAGLLLPSTPLFAAPQSSSAEIEWKRAFVVGMEGKKPAANFPLFVEAQVPVRLALVLEGTRAQLPVYCSAVQNLRIDGRAIPDRIVLSPEDAKLSDAEVQWIVLHPGSEAETWKRTPVEEKKWAIDVQEFPGEEVPGLPPSWGTVRFAAAVRAPGKGGKPVLLESSGWSSKSTAEGATSQEPGLRVSRSGGISLSGQAFALAHLPVRNAISDDAFQKRLAMRPVDLVLGAIENQAKVTLPTSRSASLTSEDWAWLFEPIRSGIHRRQTSSPLVDSAGRPIAHMYQPLNNAVHVKPGDVLVAGDQYAILEEDDGDRWLSEGDPIAHTVHGEVRRGKVSELPGKTIDALRPRSFLQLRADLRRAGYGGNERNSAYLGPELLKSVREFQRDHHLQPTGVPDAATLAALKEVLGRLDAPSGAAAPSPVKSTQDSSSAQAAPR